MCCAFISWRLASLFLAVIFILSASVFASAKTIDSNKVIHPIDRFESSVRSMELADALHMPAPGGTVFVGSSTFAHWKTMEVDLKDLSAINRGFGGSTLPEVDHYFDRLVVKYKPARVVIYCGTNDLADGHTAQDVANDFAGILARAHKELPGAEVYFISMSMAPSRVQWAKEYVEGNKLIAAMAASDKHFHYIDVTPVMYDSRGMLHKDYFGPDNLHMNRTGYEAWIPVIRQALAPVKGSTPAPQLVAHNILPTHLQ